MPVAAALAFTNIPGERATAYPWQDWRMESTCVHGWPFTWLVRQATSDRTVSVWAITNDVCYLNWTGLTG
ncbi:MAG: hypothetical protein ACREHD_03735, partial [Pirellulales bacterium]